MRRKKNGLLFEAFVYSLRNLVQVLKGWGEVTVINILGIRLSRVFPLDLFIPESEFHRTR